MTDDPSQYESDVVLLYTRLSPESLHFRFFGTAKWDPPAAARLTRTDDRHEVVLIGESSGRIDAVALYALDAKAAERAEVAFTIADAVQGQGIGPACSSGSAKSPSSIASAASSLTSTRSRRIAY